MPLATPPKTGPKWERHAIETCKQCGRLWLPKFDILPDLDALLADTAGDTLIATATCDPLFLSCFFLFPNPNLHQKLFTFWKMK